MKKTLITLAALAMASVAQADVFEDHLKLEGWNVGSHQEYNDTTFSGDNQAKNTTTNDAFTLVLALDWDTAVSFGNGKTFVDITDVTNNWYGIQLSLGVTGTSLSVSLSTDCGGVYAVRGTTDSYSKDDFCNNGLLKLALTFDGAETFTLSALKNDADGTMVGKTITNAENWLNAGSLTRYGDVVIGKKRSDAWAGNEFTGVKHVLGFNTDLSGAELSTATRAIPEPTTATLSLLALAGLAARRRRK